MHILFLTQIVPYPPDAGPKVKTWNVLRYLAQQGHQVTLVSFVRQEEQLHMGPLCEVCDRVYGVPMRRSRLADIGYWLRSNLTGRPFLIERDDLAAMRSLVWQILENEDIEAVHADQLSMAQFVLDRKTSVKAVSGKQLPPVLVFDAHNAVWTIMDRMRQTAPWFLRPVVALEALRTKHFEGKVLCRYDHTLAVAEPDRLALLEAWKICPDGPERAAPSITVVPIAVDAEQLQPVTRSTGTQNILTMGTLHYPPNADGVRWFAREVFPLIRQQIPAVTLTIIGKNPPEDFLQLQAGEPDVVKVTGYVPDLVPYLEQAALMVVAVRAGGGMRVRILEAFARGIPVVTTTIGLEGIDAEPGRDVLVADTPQDFAHEVMRLLGDPVLQRTLVDNGRRLVEKQYDWRVVLGDMNEIYPTPIAEPNGEMVSG